LRHFGHFGQASNASAGIFRSKGDRLAASNNLSAVGAGPMHQTIKKARRMAVPMPHIQLAKD
jgi:hypothetical protein